MDEYSSRIYEVVGIHKMKALINAELERDGERLVFSGTVIQTERFHPNVPSGCYCTAYFPLICFRFTSVVLLQ